MFLSSTVQSPSNNPSSSSNPNHSSDELAQSHLSTFSIRDYVSSYRSKNINKSWPFSSTSLQLCLRHGLSDPLPPIQPLGSVTTHTVLPSEALSLKKPNITHVSYKRKSEKLKNGLSAATANTSGSKSKIQVANKIPRKKIGLVVKLGACVNNSGSKEESMGLRTCPICKTFSSASNTTLNAHIDQCLSVDSVQQPVSKPSKPRVKPRMKVKTMVDIYASAKGCTLEDLDKRNGTKWAMISSHSNQLVSDDKPEVSKQGKKRSVLRVRIDEDAPGIGPVYIDAKGQKLRILSEFNKKSSESSREHEDVSEKRSSGKDKRDKSFRKRLRGKKDYKHSKVVPQKLTVRKGNASEIPQSRRGYSEEGRGTERSETSSPDQRRLFNQRMLRKGRLVRNEDNKGTKICDQPSENGHSLSEDPRVLRGPSHVSTDSSDTDSSPLDSLNSWRVCGESQVSGKSWSVSRRKITKNVSSVVTNALRCPLPPAADKVFPSEATGVMKWKKARFDFSDNEDEEDTGKWDSEMTQEQELTDYDDWEDNEETDKMLLSGQDNGYESYEETGNNKRDEDDYMLDKSDDADAEFESMVYEKTGCETAERGSSFMEVDPIPIPGPPGSFLPSPWDMGTDATETHGNSSVITSQVHSSQDQPDLTDRNSSASPISTISNFAAPETHTLFHNISTIDKRPSRFRDSDQSCCCPRKEKVFEDTTFMQPPQHMIQQDLSKSVSVIPSNSNPVLRLMGKDLMVINQREEPTLGLSSLTPTSQFQDLSKTQQLSPHVHLPYGGNGLYFDNNTSFYNVP